MGGDIDSEALGGFNGVVAGGIARHGKKPRARAFNALNASVFKYFFEYALRHRAAAGVARADKKYPLHSLAPVEFKLI